MCQPYSSPEWQATLQELCSVQEMQVFLRRLPCVTTDTQLISSRLLRQKPGRRALIEYRLERGGNSPPLLIVGKYREKGVDKFSFCCQQALWSDGFHQQNRIRVPEPLMLLPEKRMWLQRHVDGLLLTDVLLSDVFSRHGQISTGTAVGYALSVLQQHGGLARVVNGRWWTLTDELSVLEQGLTIAAEENAALHGRINALMKGLREVAVVLSGTRKSSLHRDFYPDQIISNRNDRHCLTLLDFDLCCTGPSALDAGNWLAHVCELGIRHRGDYRIFHAHESAFVESWLSHMSGVTAKETEGFRLLSLARHIFLSTRIPGRKHTTPLLLAYCEKCMELF
ncbi:TPA: phosphotransferase [Escherichia coli]|nr:phosphotransferase [Escherichia coli]